MAPPPIVMATIQSSVLTATSNLLAQAITSYQNETPLIVDWVPVFQFILYAAISTPPNFLWQEFLESTFPAYHMSPTPLTVASASASDEKALDKSAKQGKLIAPQLNKTNTAIKWVLDQSVGAALNTVLFSMFMNSLQMAMVRPLGAPPSTPDKSASYLVSRGAVDYAKVDWQTVVQKSKGEFWGLLIASFKLWPFVSIINFVFVKTVAGRNLVGNLANVIWGIQMSLAAAQ